MVLPLGQVDRLQVLIAGADWDPVLVDEQGEVVLAKSKTQSEVYLLTDPDLLNNQGLAQAQRRAGRPQAILRGPARRADSVNFLDVTLNGFTRGRGIGRLMLEPPWLAATLCGVAAALLMGLHGLARFGPTLDPRPRHRARQAGARSTTSWRPGARRRAASTNWRPAYATLTRTLIRRRRRRRGSRGDGPRKRPLASRPRPAKRGARGRWTSSPGEAERAQSRDDLLAVGRKLYLWRVEITGERR